MTYRAGCTFRCCAPCKKLRVQIGLVCMLGVFLDIDIDDVTDQQL